MERRSALKEARLTLTLTRTLTHTLITLTFNPSLALVLAIAIAIAIALCSNYRLMVGGRGDGEGGTMARGVVRAGREQGQRARGREDERVSYHPNTAPQSIPGKAHAG